MPDFTIEKLHNLNTQLLTIVSEDDSVCKVFTRLQEQHQNTSSASPSEPPSQTSVLAAAIQEIPLDGDVIPNPHRHILKSLELISQANLSNEYSKAADGSKEEVNLLSWVLAAKSTAVLYTTVLERLLNSTLPLSKDIFYWEELQGSSLRETYYIIQTMPSRIYSLTTATIRSVRDHTQTVSLASPREFITTVSRASRSNILHLFPTYLHSRLRTRQLYIPSMIHFEIKSKCHRLRSIRKYQAACLGLLMDRGLDFSAKEGETAQNVLQRQISRSLELIERVLKQLRDIEVKDQMNIPNIHSLFSQNSSNQLSLKETHDSIARLFNQLLPDLTDHCQNVVDLYGRPGVVTRYWPMVVGGYFLTSKSIKWVSNNKDSIEQWVSEAKSTGQDFLWNWVWEPVKKVWETVRMENREYRVLGKKSLESDLDSLERMAIEFGRETCKLSPAELEDLRKQVRAGDLSTILQVYENEIKQPVKNAVAGSLIRALLIQVQKSKVDVDLSLAALDKLLKSNELNFAFLAVGPTLVLLWFAIRQARIMFGRRSGAQLEQVVEPIRSSLRDIERLLNLADKPLDPSLAHSSHQVLPFQEQGLIFCEAHLLRSYAKVLPVHNNIRGKFMEDLREIENAKLSIRQRLGTVRRMWRTWGFLSKRDKNELDA